jgi:hypothetical protein
VDKTSFHLFEDGTQHNKGLLLQSNSFSFYFINLRYKNVAQRLVAQALGHIRVVVIIVTTILKPQLSVRSWSLGQVACSHVLGIFIFNNSGT